MDDYRLEAEFAELMPIGLVADGIRMDNQFAGTVVEGGLRVPPRSGPTTFRIRTDWVGVVNGHRRGRTAARSGG